MTTYYENNRNLKINEVGKTQKPNHARINWKIKVRKLNEIILKVLDKI